ncbi:MAG: serine/threonine-protein phosphatase [Rhodocyclaceae bacterium]|nr:serine/threonine-protein phosphatase [Rhodocyclaceae bacterium]
MSGLSNSGCVRSLNEDAHCVEPDIGLMVVADGMGGHNAGDLAATMAVESISAHVRQAITNGPPSGASDAESLLADAVKHANDAILERARGREQLKGMGTTVACLLMHGEQATIAHLGDSRAYRLAAGKLRLLTRDHSLTQEVREMGVIGEDAIAASHNRHLVSHALGHDEKPPIALHTVPCMPGDIFMLCTDGLNDMVDGIDLELALRVLRSNLSLAAEQLVMIARDNGGFDNITVTLAKVPSQDAPATAAGDAGEGSAFGRLRGWLRSLLGGGH